MKIFKEILGGSIVASLVVFSGFVALEAQIAGASDGGSTSPDTDVATITQVVAEGLTISDGANVTMSRTLAFTGASTATGSTSWVVATNAQAGYRLDVEAAGNTCAGTDILCNESADEAFTDYTEAVANVPESWSVANAYEFGFSAITGSGATTVNTTVYGTPAGGTDCATGAAGHINDTGLNYIGFNAATKIEIASSSDATIAAGEQTIICFASEQNGTALAPVGTYIATTTATATSL